MDEISNLVY